MVEEFGQRLLFDAVEISLLEVHPHFLKADILESADEIPEELPLFHPADVGKCWLGATG